MHPTLMLGVGKQQGF